jgi:5-methylcytosine-specific restriction endonuclease McrA
MANKRTKEDYESAVCGCFSISEALRRLGLVPAGGNYSTFMRDVKKFGVDISHFTGQAHLKGKSCPWTKKRPLSEVLVKDSDYTATSCLRKRLVDESYFDHRCYSCDLTEWMGSPIPLELEHVNGDNTDNRIENLTLLCPNCHALTSTYRGKNIGYRRVTRFCPDCGCEVSRYSKSGYCVKCVKQHWKKGV